VITSKTLSYDKTANAPRLATIPIAHIDMRALDLESDSGDWSFELKKDVGGGGGDREFTLRAESATQARVWVSKLQAFIRRASVFDIGAIKFSQRKSWKRSSRDV
jgi:hypothetical protein